MSVPERVGCALTIGQFVPRQNVSRRSESPTNPTTRWAPLLSYLSNLEGSKFPFAGKCFPGVKRLASFQYVPLSLRWRCAFYDTAHIRKISRQTESYASSVFSFTPLL